VVGSHRRLADGIRWTNDHTALDIMLAPDFELRTSSSGGEITLCDEWVQAVTTTYNVRSFRISRLTVRPQQRGREFLL